MLRSKQIYFLSKRPNHDADRKHEILCNIIELLKYTVLVSRLQNSTKIYWHYI